MDNILPPHSEQAEQAVLGALLIDPQAVRDVAPFLKPEHFYIVHNGWIYDAILAQGEHADLMTVAGALAAHNKLDEVGGESYLAQLTAAVPTALNAAAYARIVEDYATRRAGIVAAQNIAKLCFAQDIPIDDVTSGCMRALDMALRGGRRTSSVALGEEVAEFAAEVEARYNDPTLAAGVPTGFADIDKILGGGLHRGEMIVVAARPGMGKTSLLNAIALNVSGGSALHRPPKRHVVYYASLEMGRRELVNRFVSAESGIDSQRLRAGRLRDDEWNAMSMATMRVSDATIHLDDSPSATAEEIARGAAYVQYRHGLDVLVVDYLGLLRGHGDAYERTSAAARDLKNMARKLNVPLLVASQLSRACESRDNKRPQLSDLRDSGEVEQAADIVMFIYRDEYYNGATDVGHLAEVNVAKNRNGPTGKAELFFDKALTQFKNLSRVNL